MPVHLEQRYLIPAVPLIWILAALAATQWLEARHGRFAHGSAYLPNKD